MHCASRLYGSISISNRRKAMPHSTKPSTPSPLLSGETTCQRQVRLSFRVEGYTSTGSVTVLLPSPSGNPSLTVSKNLPFAQDLNAMLASQRMLHAYSVWLAHLIAKKQRQDQSFSNTLDKAMTSVWTSLNSLFSVLAKLP